MTLSGLELLPFVGGAVEGLCNLGSNLVDGILGPEGVFAQTLDALSGGNRFRDPGLAPGEQARMLEEQLLRLEQLIAERRGMLSQQADLLSTTQKIQHIAAALARTSLTKEGREAVLASVTTFLSNATIAEQLGTEKPQVGDLSVQLDAMLQQFNLPEQERLAVLQKVQDVLNGVEEQKAA
ncbi:MAG TPA: hypothetical protein VMY39_02055 [Planctomycetota bacterium]|nr:hypothetical protein [Planctomycetota bacterium]